MTASLSIIEIHDRIQIIEQNRTNTHKTKKGNFDEYENLFISLFTYILVPNYANELLLDTTYIYLWKNIIELFFYHFLVSLSSLQEYI